MNDIKEYIKELTQMKSLGIITGEKAEELDNLIKMLNVIEEQSQNTQSNDEGFKIPIKFVNESKNEDPIWAKEGDSGFDLRSTIGGTLKPLDRMLVPTGLFFELPNGYELQIRPRSGLAARHGVTVLNSPGTIDTGYKGEIKVILVNLSNENFTFNEGERIAQGVVTTRVSTEFGKMIKLESVEELAETERGIGGFGSTGKK